MFLHAGRPKSRGFAAQDAPEIPTEPVSEMTGDRATEGHIGLQSHESGAKLAFRHVRLVELKV